MEHVFQGKLYMLYPDDYHIDKIKESDEKYTYQLFPPAMVKKNFLAYQEEQNKSAIHVSSENEKVPLDFC